MQLVYKGNKSSVRHQLIYAQQKLLTDTIPLQIRAVSYVRLCCAAMRRYHRLKIATQIHTEWDVKVPYLGLLKLLSDVDPAWWNQCHVSQDGCLESNNPTIHELLYPLNNFIYLKLETIAA